MVHRGGLSGRDTSRLDLPADALAWLAQQPTAPRERYAPGTLLRLAVRTVRTLVGTGPAVLVVEDLHALDPASLNLVGELATADGLPALLMVATRPAAHAVAPALTGRTLARLCGVRGVVRQHLGPLRPAEVAEILNQVYADSAADARLVHRVWQHTAGNPYALTELLAAHADRDTLLTLAATSAAVSAAAGPEALGSAAVGPAVPGSAAVALIDSVSPIRRYPAAPYPAVSAIRCAATRTVAATSGGSAGGGWPSLPRRRRRRTRVGRRMPSGGARRRRRSAGRPPGRRGARR